MVYPLIEPVTAGLVVALINKFILNNHGLWELCTNSPSHVIDHEDTNSSTTSINDLEIAIHHM